MTNVKFFLRKLAISLLVFLFIFTSQPGLILAAEDTAASPAPAPAEASVPATTPAETPAPDSSPSGEVNTPAETASTPSTDATAPETATPSTDTPATTDAQSLDQAKKDAEAQNPQPQTLLDEEDPAASFSDARKPVANKLGTETDLSSGALIYTLPLTIPPGRNKLQPDLKLVYNSQTSENDNLFGFGWSVNIPYIERTAKEGVDKLYSTNHFTLSIAGELEPVDLSDSTHGIYGAKVDNGEFLDIEYNANNYWLVTDKKGTVYKFGYNSSARQDDPDNSAHAFKWMLEEVRDTNNNYIKYEYYKDSGQIYPADIKYTGYNTTDGIFEIDFSRESRNDNMQSFKTGFEVVTDYRIYEIQAKASGAWVHKYELEYGAGDNGIRSVISSITESGQDGQSNVIALPTNDFSYQTKTKTWTEDENYSLPYGFTAGNSYDTGLRIADVNGDGLQDLLVSFYLYSSGGIDYYIKHVYINKGDGTGWEEDTNYTIPAYFAYSAQNDTGTRLADVNGDGLVDIVYAPSVLEQSKVYINKGDGTGWAEDTNYTIPVSFSNTHDTGARLEDINGDGLPDIVYSNYWDDDKVYINKGDGTGWALDANWSVPEPFVLGGSYGSGANLVDVNGDGLADLIRGDYYNNIKKVYLNTGHSWVYDSNWVLPEFFVGRSNHPMMDRGTRLGDINGDGLVDIIYSPDGAQYENDTYIPTVYINTGKGWVEDSNWTLPEAFIYQGGKDTGLRLSDVNGDGLTDFVMASGNSGNYNNYANKVYIANPSNADLLSQVNNSQGGESDITYKGSAQYIDNGVLQNPDLPYVTQTVNYIEYDDGLGDTSYESYSYVGGDYYYEDYLNRKVAGFNKIAKVDAAGNVGMTYFHQGNGTDSSNGEYSDDGSKIGKPYRTELFDDNGDVWNFSVNKWENYDLGDDRDFVKQTQTIGFTFDGNTSHKDTAETYAYDNANGNLTEKITYGEVSGNANGTFTDTGSDKFTTDIDYAATSGSDVIGLPSQETTEDQNSNKVKETKYYYDSLTLGNVDEGNLTKQEMWKDGSNYINAQKTYNSYGLVTVDTDPRGKTTDYTYDTYNLYPATVTNALDQDTDYTYDYSSGKPTQVTDPNSRVFQTVYDALDRPLQEKQPDLTTPTNLVVKSEYVYTDNTVPTKVQQTNNLDSSTSFDTYTYFDGFGRKVQERKEAESSNTFSVKDYAYNDIGLLDKESLPYFSTGSSRTTATTDTALYTSYTYDPMQRVSTATNAVGTTTNTYDDWKLTITDAESNVKDLYKDAYDNLVQVDEHNNSSTYTTNYEYNGLGNLTKITDSQDNIRNFTYDGLGRRLTAQDLHDPNDQYFGTWTYTYDDSGNLSSRVDPKSQTVNWTYDDINRVLTENYTGQSGNEVAYVGDTGTDGIGRLYTATTADVVSTYTYNPLGGVKTENKNIDSTNYLTEYAYDRLGNQTLITYPSGDQAKYVFNTAGLLETVQGKPNGAGSFIDLVSNYDYSPLEQVTYQENANGTKTFNDYDSQKLYRLKEKITSSPDEGNYGEGMKMMMNANSPVVASVASATVSAGNANMANGNSYENTKPYESTNGNDLISAAGQAVSGFLNTVPGGEMIAASLGIGTAGSSAVTLSLVEGPAETGSLDGSTKLTMTSSPVKPAKTDDKVQHDFLGRPVSYDNYPKDQTIYLKADPNFKPQPLPKEAIEMFDKANENQKPKITTLPQDMIDFLSKQQEAKGNGGQGMMLLSANSPLPSTDLKSENLWRSENILNNSGFENGFDYWQWQNNLDATHEEDCTVSHSGSCSEKVVVNTTGDFWKVQVSQPVKLIAGKAYTWKFWAKASTATSFSLQAYMNHDPWTQQGLYRTENIGTDWQEYTYTFTPVTTDDNSVISLHLAAHAGTYWLDDASLTPDDLNVIKEPSFEDWASNWNFYSRGTPYGTGTNEVDCTAAVDGDCSDKATTTAEGAYWEVALSQPVSVVADQTYILTFYAKSNWDTRTVKAAITKNYGDYMEITDTVSFQTNYNGGFAKYQIELTPTSTQSNARLIFYLGETQGIFWADQVKLWPKQATKVSDTTPEFSAIYDDPNAGDYATDYQIQVIPYDGDWDSPIWDSGQTAFGSNVLEGNRTADISYGGTPLGLNGMKYKWRIKLWDDEDNEGEWTNGNDFFVMAGKRIQDLTYTYDDVGNITRIEDESETNTGKVAEYTYDDLYRLTTATITDSATNDDYVQNFTYDSLGNILSFPDNGDYEYNGNQGSSYANPHAVTYLPDINVHVNYDNNGNLVSEIWSPYQVTIFSATWDYNNRLVSNTSLSDPAEYAYDHTGQRIKQDIDSGGDVTIYPNKYYNVDTQGETSKVTEHVYDNKGNMILTAENDGTNLTLHYDHTDHLGGSSVMTDNSGVAEQVIDYYPFGSMRFNQKETSFDEQRKHTGHEYDGNTDLTYMNARYYAGVAGRFVSEDSVFLDIGTQKDLKNILSDPQSLNSYAYSQNNPLSYLDPTGAKSFRANLSSEMRAKADSLRNYPSFQNQKNGQIMQFIFNIFADSVSDFANVIDPETTSKGRLVSGIWLGLAVVPESKGVKGIGALDDALKLLNPDIKIIGEQFGHVLDSHTEGGILSAGKSIFNKGEDIYGLIKSGTQQAMQLQEEGGNFKRVFDAGRNIGVDRVTNQQTSIMTIITNVKNELITAFPGIPTK